MKTFILFLTLAIFLQTTIIPANLCLIIIVCRGLIVDDRVNFYIVFILGVALGLLLSVNIGFYALIFLFLSYLLSIFKKSSFSSNFLLFLPIAFLSYFFTALLEKLFLNQTISLYKILFELLLTIPIYFMIRFWEERFVPKAGIKLKI